MRITRQEYNDARTKREKFKERLAEVESIIKTWEDAEKQYGKPRDGDEIVAFLIEDGTTEAVARRKAIEEAPHMRKSG